MSQTDEHFQLDTPKVPKGTKLLIVRAPYYKDISDDLLKGAEKAIKDGGATFELIDVPGALEIPTTISIAASSNKFDGFVALGCVIRGETTHYETVCNDSSRALTLLGLQGCCIGNGILTVELRRKSAARLYAVQALFQMEASGTGIDRIIEEFETHRFGADVDGDTYEEGDPKHFKAIVENALTHQAKIDQLTDKALARTKVL